MIPVKVALTERHASGPGNGLYHPYTRQDAEWWIEAGSKENSIQRIGVQKTVCPGARTNNASMRVLEKCGYTLEAVKAFEVFKDGEYFDIYHYARLGR